MDITILRLNRALVAALQAGGVGTVGELCERNARELLDIPRLGPSALKRIEAELSALGLRLSADPWAPYECARHRNPTGDSSITGLFLCTLCHDSFGKVLGNPEFASGETYKGYCAHCNAQSQEIRLVQWYLCGNCDRKVRSLGRGIAAHKHFADLWETTIRPHLPHVELEEVDITTIRLANDMTDNSTEDFRASVNGKALALFELKSGRSRVLKTGVGARMAEFQLDTSDCDGIRSIAAKHRKPTYLVNVQVVNRYQPPTTQHSGLEIVFADLWALQGAFLRTQQRPRERKQAAYFATTAFRPLADFPTHMQSPDFATAEQALLEEGPPSLY